MITFICVCKLQFYSCFKRHTAMVDIECSLSSLTWRSPCVLALISLNYYVSSLLAVLTHIEHRLNYAMYAIQRAVLCVLKC